MRIARQLFSKIVFYFGTSCVYPFSTIFFTIGQSQLFFSNASSSRIFITTVLKSRGLIRKYARYTYELIDFSTNKSYNYIIQIQIILENEYIYRLKIGSYGTKVNKVFKIT